MNIFKKFGLIEEETKIKVLYQVLKTDLETQRIQSQTALETIANTSLSSMGKVFLAYMIGREMQRTQGLALPCVFEIMEK